MLEPDRRRFLQGLAAAAACLSLPRRAPSADGATAGPDVALQIRFDEPQRIRAIDVVRIGSQRFVRVVSDSGDVGAVADNGRLADLASLFERRVVPFFVGRDARDVVRLVDEVYVADSNYKFAGMPLWCAVAHVELAVLDLLGRVAGKSAGALFAPVRRTAVPVYLTRLTRETTAEQEVGIVSEQLARCGAKACKLKIGGRFRNAPADVVRTDALVPLARRRLGESVAIFVDANSSYSVDEAIAVGRRLEEHRVGFFEEPCAWEDHEATKRVADALDVPVAGGEQDTSWPRWKWMVANRGVDLLQPDVYYLGGLIRSLRLARLAEAAKLPITPHSPKTGAAALPMLQFASVVPNLGPFQEYAFSPEIVDGRVKIPDEPGLGLGITDGELRKATA